MERVDKLVEKYNRLWDRLSEQGAKDNDIAKFEEVIIELQMIEDGK